MRTLYLECQMGAAGDMLMAALLELSPDPDGFVARMNALDLPGVQVAAEPSIKCGITGTHMRVTVLGQEEHSHDHHHDGHDHGHGHDHPHVPVSRSQPRLRRRPGQEQAHSHPGGHQQEHIHHAHSHDHDHGHDHSHTHSHSGLHDIQHILERLDISPKVRQDALAVYRLIAEAESHAHGVPVADIHFHEVGTMDAIADVVGVCILMEQLAPQKVIATPVHVGSGQVRCAHGILPVPAPATAHILKDVPIYGGSIRGELCTPTGAALLKHFVHAFGNMPPMVVQATGYGMGTKDFETANCVRASIGETGESGDEIIELSCNLDDCTPESIGFALETLMSAGALDAYTQPIGMKKSRPGILLSCLCRPQDRELMVQLLFQHTTTLGIRESAHRRYTLARREETLQTAGGPVRVKISEGYGTTRRKAEYQDLARIARDRSVSLQEARAMLEEEARK